METGKNTLNMIIKIIFYIENYFNFLKGTKITCNKEGDQGPNTIPADISESFAGS